MRSLKELNLLGIMLANPVRPSPDNNPQLWKTLLQLGYDLGRWDDWTETDIKEEAYRILGSVENDFSYYDASELKTNGALNHFLVSLHHDFANRLRKKTAREIALLVCANGNKVASRDDTGGVNLWINQGMDIIEALTESFEQNDQTDGIGVMIRDLEYVDAILKIVDVFVTSHTGMLLGVEEYRPADYNDVYPLYVPDFVVGNECGGDESCECGCNLDHPLMLLQGVEDLMDGKETDASRYLAGVYFANDYKLGNLAGNEEGAFDAIVDAGVKAYEWVRDALKSFFELFTTEKAEEESKETADVGENNKKAIQAMPDKSMRISNAAKQGIVALAQQTDTSGAMGKVVASLNNAGDASRVIDGLQALLNKQLGKSGKLQEKLTKAQTALNDLKAANTKASADKGKQDNKDVAANTKTNVKDKIAKAKDAVKEVRAAVGAQRKIVAGYKKAIKGISPKIFTLAAGDNTAAKEGEAKPPATEAAPATTPAAAPAAPAKATGKATGKAKGKK